MRAQVVCKRAVQPEGGEGQGDECHGKCYTAEGCNQYAYYAYLNTPRYTTPGACLLNGCTVQQLAQPRLTDLLVMADATAVSWPFMEDTHPLLPVTYCRYATRKLVCGFDVSENPSARRYSNASAETAI
jgi:hypothetical protein